MSDLTSLWDEVMEIGYITRKQKEPGLINWNKIKERCYQLNTQKVKLRLCLNTLFDAMVTIIQVYLSANPELCSAVLANEAPKDKTEWEKWHFFFQTLRIPQKITGKGETGIINILQIAYNVGQFKAEHELGNYSVPVCNFYKMNKLELLETYIEK